MIKSQIHIPWTSFPVWSIFRLIICNVDRIISRGTITFSIITRSVFSQAAVGLCRSFHAMINTVSSSSSSSSTSKSHRCFITAWVIRRFRFCRRVIFRISPSNLTTSAIFWHRSYKPIAEESSTWADFIEDTSTRLKMHRSNYRNSYEWALQDLIDLEIILHRTQTDMNGGKPDITF